MIGTENDFISRVGESFGNSVGEMFSRSLVRSMTVSEVKDGNAYCLIYEGDEALPVPLDFMAIPEGMLRVTPKVGTSVLVGFVNGDENAPCLLHVAEADEIYISISGENDEVEEQKTTIRIAKDVLEMNGGLLNGLVIVGKLTERLNKMQEEIDKIQDNIDSHSHSYIDSVGSAGAPSNKTTTGTSYTRISLTDVQNSDYENEKVKQ